MQEWCLGNIQTVQRIGVVAKKVHDMTYIVQCTYHICRALDDMLLNLAVFCLNAKPWSELPFKTVLTHTPLPGQYSEDRTLLRGNCVQNAMIFWSTGL